MHPLGHTGPVTRSLYIFSVRKGRPRNRGSILHNDKSFVPLQNLLTGSGTIPGSYSIGTPRGEKRPVEEPYLHAPYMSSHDVCLDSFVSYRAIHLSPDTARQ